MSEYEEVKRKSNYIKFNKVNDHIQGTLVKVTVPAEPDSYGRMDKKYTILCESGIVFGGEMEKDTGNYIVDKDPTTLEAGREYIVTGKVSLDSSMAELKLGQKCIIQLAELKPSKKGSRPAKIMKVFAGGLNDEWLKSQAAIAPAEEITTTITDPVF